MALGLPQPAHPPNGIRDRGELADHGASDIATLAEIGVVPRARQIRRASCTRPRTARRSRPPTGERSHVSRFQRSSVAAAPARSGPNTGRYFLCPRSSPAFHAGVRSDRQMCGGRSLARHDHCQYFLGDAFMPGARPGLIRSGPGVGFSLGFGRDSVGPLPAVNAGMHSGCAGGPFRTSESRALTAEVARSSQLPPCVPAGSLIVTVAVMSETSGMPAGTLSIAMRTGTRWAKRTQV